ncbi:hypothetical protein [Arenibacter troitsensis]|uniref:Uncharacterized protein n=1 Tax=Arenibacter troitsensis TaxID=188872 RepID=A0A1X7J7I5_9FLAO|nr:hypothetical protein [Arenibacter troitsensis]SMG23597.1 hypothetical protein SAMN03080602_01458 [Arenibacter troitsensis]
MSIFNDRGINGTEIAEKITKILNLSASMKLMERPSRDKWRNNEPDKEAEIHYNLTPHEEEFIERVSKDMTKEEIKQLKEKIQADPNFVNPYSDRQVLKDVSTGQLKPKSHFAVDINFPARGFRAIKVKETLVN